MMKIQRVGIMLMLLASTLLAACSGGGGAVTPAGPVTSALSFPLQSAYKALVANGATKTFVVSGSCTGTATITSAPANTPAVFEANLSALSAASSLTATLTSAPGFTCAPTLAVASTDYYDISYVPLGHNTVGTDYGVWLTPPIILASVIVGGAGVVGTETLYTNSLKVTSAGRTDASYVVEPDTATTAIVNLVGKNYDAAGVLVGTQQSRYRISATGALAPVSVDILYSTGIHWIMK